MKTSQVKKEICKTCNNYSKLENIHFCKYLHAFLEDETLSLPCELWEVKK